jgi:hypothetical protein
MSEEWVPQAPADVPVGPGYSKLIQIDNDADALLNNLRWAKAAVSYARMFVPYLGNKPLDILVTAGGSWLGNRIARYRFEHDGKKYATMLASCREKAESAKNSGSGNCGEVSAIAFIYLYDSMIRPIDWMEVKGGDHNFVLIGRKSQNPANKDTWGEPCAVSDPWQKISRAASLMKPVDLLCSGGSKQFASALRIE